MDAPDPCTLKHIFEFVTSVWLSDNEVQFSIGISGLQIKKGASFVFTIVITLWLSVTK